MMFNYCEILLNLKTTIIGADQVGKTSLFRSVFLEEQGYFEEDLTINYQDLPIDNHATIRVLDYTQLAKDARHYATKSTVVFILIFNINDNTSFTYLKNEVKTIHSIISKQKLTDKDYSFILIANNKPNARNTKLTMVEPSEIKELSDELQCQYFSLVDLRSKVLKTIYKEIYTETIKIAGMHAHNIRDLISEKKKSDKKAKQEKRTAEIKAKLEPYSHFILNLIINIGLIIFAVFTLGWCLYSKYQGRETIYEENSRVRGKFYKFWGDDVDENTDGKNKELNDLIYL